MKRLVVLVVLAGFAAIPFATAQARTNGAEASARTVCHRTSSAARPYAKLRVTAAQQRAHLRHPADIVPAPRAACPRTVLSPTAGGTAFRVHMAGENESPTGDPVGTGEAVVRVRRGQGQVCYSIEAENITLPAAGAHIHRGAAGATGGIVVQFRAPGGQGQARGCSAASRGLVAQLLRSPARFYVNVHTTDFPAGAIRGQLAGSSDDHGWITTVNLTGAAECNAAGTCNLGDADGTGTATVRIRRDAGLVCYRLRVQNVLLPAIGAHIHRGARTSAGGIVVNFDPPGASGTSAGCTAATAALIDEIVATPANFYVNVHTTDRPAGAVRGQLG